MKSPPKIINESNKSLDDDDWIEFVWILIEFEVEVEELEVEIGSSTKLLLLFLLLLPFSINWEVGKEIIAI